jgi:ketosteroid isomerase-like protein
MWSDHREFAKEWVEAWNSHDLNRVLSHYEEDVVLHSARIKLILGKEEGMIRGKAALRDYMGMALKRVPDLRFTLDRVFSGVNAVVLEFHTHQGRHTAEFMEFGRNGLVSRASATDALD